MKKINTVFKTDTLNLCECKDGFWLYDTTRGMNLAMKSPTEREAFIEALLYYQKRLSKLEKEHKKLTTEIESFVNRFSFLNDSD